MRAQRALRSRDNNADTHATPRSYMEILVVNTVLAHSRNTDYRKFSGLVFTASA